jgi:hypothetical protein
MAARVSVRANTGVTLELYVLDCPDCGVVFAISDEYDDRRRKDGQGFYCPNNHVMSYTPGKSAETKLKEAEAREIALQDQLRAAAAEIEQTKATLLRDRHRFANGVCPCCTRTFQNVARHMVSQHPDYDLAQVQVGHEEKPFTCSCGRTFHTLGGLHQHQTKQRGPGWFKPTAGKYGAHLTVV